jgi:hypothetical protein
MRPMGGDLTRAEHNLDPAGEGLVVPAHHPGLRRLRVERERPAELLESSRTLIARVTVEGDLAR